VVDLDGNQAPAHISGMDIQTWYNIRFGFVRIRFIVLHDDGIGIIFDD
jgi:hypothetical protein